MKKLLLVPFIALSLMTGCDLMQPKMITLDRWLENADDEKIANGWCNLYYKGFKSYDMYADDWDYDNYVLKAIKENVTGNYTRKNKRIEETGEIFFVYLLQNKIDDDDACLLYVYENHIMTYSDIVKGNKYYQQRAYYEYDIEVGKKIINAAVERAKEKKDTSDREIRLAEQEATIENFLAKAEETTTFTMTYNNSNITDENRSFLNALKNKELIKADSEERVYLRDENKLAIYQLNENLSLWLAKDSFITKFNNNNEYNIIQVCYHYKPKFIKDSIYREGEYGHRTTYLISKEAHSELTQVLDSLVAE